MLSSKVYLFGLMHFLILPSWSDVLHSRRQMKMNQEWERYGWRKWERRKDSKKKVSIRNQTRLDISHAMPCHAYLHNSLTLDSFSFVGENVIHQITRAISDNASDQINIPYLKASQFYTIYLKLLNSFFHCTHFLFPFLSLTFWLSLSSSLIDSILICLFLFLSVSFCVYVSLSISIYLSLSCLPFFSWYILSPLFPDAVVTAANVCLRTIQKQIHQRKNVPWDFQSKWHSRYEITSISLRSQICTSLIKINVTMIDR